MLKKTMTYEDYNGETVTEDFYFSISKAELIELEIESGEGGYSGLLKKIIAAEDNVAMLATFKDIIARSVGRRSDDGKRFVKSDEITRDFQQSPAYDQLLLSFYTDENAAVEFVTGIVPGDMAEAVKKGALKGLEETPEPAKDDGSEPAPAEKAPKYLNDLTPEQIEAMPYDQFKEFQGRTQAGRMDALQVQAAYRRSMAGK